MKSPFRRVVDEFSQMARNFLAVDPRFGYGFVQRGSPRRLETARTRIRRSAKACTRVLPEVSSAGRLFKCRNPESVTVSKRYASSSFLARSCKMDVITVRARGLLSCGIIFSGRRYTLEGSAGKMLKPLSM